jgi:hypothetical protein
MLFDEVALRGLEGTVVWGYHTAAVCRTWVARRIVGGQWTLTASVVRADAFQLRQRDLKFTAPRVGGFFCWPIVAVSQTGTTLAATLGPPES